MGKASPNGHEALALEDAQDLTGPQASQAPVNRDTAQGRWYSFTNIMLLREMQQKEEPWGENLGLVVESLQASR